MRVVFLADSLVLQRAGIKKYNLELLTTIASYPNLKSLDIVIPEEDSSLQDFNQIVVPISAIPGHQRIRQYTSIPRKISKLNPDLVIEPAHFGPFALAANVKRCTVIHDLTPISYSDLHPTGSVWAHRLLMRQVLRKSDLIITNTEATKNSIISYEPSTKSIQVLYPEIDLHLGSDSMAEDSDKTPNQYLLAIGTLEPRKDYLTLIKAFERVESDCRLVIIGGEGWKHKAVDQYIAQSPKRDRIDIKGYVSESEKIHLIKHATLFVSTSIAEGLGLPLLEVMPYHVPIVCSDIPPYREIGQAQLDYVKVGDSMAFASAIDNVITSKKTHNFNNRISDWNKCRVTQLEELFTTFDQWH